MTDRPDSERRLRDLLRHAVDDVEPAHRLAAIRAATSASTSHDASHDASLDRTKVTAMSPTTPHRRSWLLGAVGAAAATATVIGGAVLMTQGGDGGTDPVSAADTSSEAPASTAPTTPASSATPSSASSPSSTHAGTGRTDVMAVYYVGDGPSGPRLFREFHRIDPADAVAQAAQTPLDPDYRTDWQPGDVVSADASGSTIFVALGSTDLADRPTGMGAAEASAAIQSLVYTAQAAYQSRDKVQFTVDGQPMTALLGVPLEGAVKAGGVFDTLSLMSISDPNEGQEVSGRFVATGVNNGPEATVAWQLKQGDRVVEKGATQADGWMEEKLFPWTVTVDLDGVAPGTYTFVAMNDDPSGGEEGGGPAVDTRTVVVTG